MEAISTPCNKQNTPLSIKPCVTVYILYIAPLRIFGGGLIFNPPFWRTALPFNGENLFFKGEASVLTNLAGDKDRLNLAIFFGDLFTDTAGGLTERKAVLIFDGTAGDLMMNLWGCCWCLLLPMIGDLVLQNLGWFEEGEERNRGLGNSTVFLVQGLFLGDTRLAATFGTTFFFSGLRLMGEVALNLIRERARWSLGDDLESIGRIGCFSILRLERSWDWLPFDCGVLRWLDVGVIGSLGLHLSAFLMARAISLANWLVWRISAIVSLTSIAGRDILLHSSVLCTSDSDSDQT